MRIQPHMIAICSSVRKVNVRLRKTGVDWAQEIKQLLDEDYPEAEKVVLVCDNLSTHSISSLYATFAPEEAWRLRNRLEIHYTPKHGSWLNIAEIEIGVLSRQCLSRYIPTRAKMRSEVAAWQQKRNQAKVTVNWQFTTTDARIKLRKLYPEI